MYFVYIWNYNSQGQNGSLMEREIINQYQKHLQLQNSDITLFIFNFDPVMM
jgi:hypothetical protein